LKISVFPFGLLTKAARVEPVVVSLVLGLPELVDPPVPPVGFDPVFLNVFPDDVPVLDPAPDPVPDPPLLPVPTPVPTAPLWRDNFLSALFELLELEEPVPPEVFDVVVWCCCSNFLSALFGLPLELPEPPLPLWPEPELEPEPEPVPEPVVLVLAGFGVAAGCD
jgi:hypothetical protein